MKAITNLIDMTDNNFNNTDKARKSVNVLINSTHSILNAI